MYDNYELMAAVELAAKLYHHELMKGHGADRGAARNYIGSRRLFAPTAEKFRIGYAPVATGPKPWILQKMNNAKLLQEAGLIIEAEDGRLRDPMEGRIVFPQVNPSGKYLGFVGRARGYDAEARYSATGSSPIFRRHEILFRIDMARQGIESEKSAIIVEGLLDAALMWQIGVRNVVAVGSKTLTDAQAQVLARYGANLQVMFDNDDAGRDGADDVRRRRGQFFKQVSRLEYPAKFKDPADWVVDRIDRAITEQQSSVRA